MVTVSTNTHSSTKLAGGTCFGNNAKEQPGNHDHTLPCIAEHLMRGCLQNLVWLRSYRQGERESLTQAFAMSIRS